MDTAIPRTIPTMMKRLFNNSIILGQDKKQLKLESIWKNALKENLQH